MQIKRFEAQDMTEALRKVKKEFGPDAVILSAKSIRNNSGIFSLIKHPGVEVTAATDTNYKEQNGSKFTSGKGWSIYRKQPGKAGVADMPKKNKTIRSFRVRKELTKNIYHPVEERHHDPEDGLKEVLNLQRRMLSQGVEPDIALDLTGIISRFESSKRLLESEGEWPCLIRALEEIGVTARPIRMVNRKQKVLAFVGPTGVGKTTTIAKLATIYAHNKENSVSLITLDDYRIGAIEQLRVYANIIGIQFTNASNSRHLKEDIRSLKEKDIILIDTPGIIQRDNNQINLLRQRLDTIRNIEVHLVLSATTKNEDLYDIIEGFNVVGINRLIFTKLDESKVYGNILNQLIRSKIPVSYLTDSQHVPEGIEIAGLEKLADLIVNEKKRNEMLLGRQDVLVTDGDKPEKDEFCISQYYVANMNSDVFHIPECKWARKIREDNIVEFKSLADAVNSEFKPCRLCNPDQVVVPNTPVMVDYPRKSSLYGC